MENVFDRRDMAEEYATGTIDLKTSRFTHTQDLNVFKSVFDGFKNAGSYVPTVLDVGCATANLYGVFRLWDDRIFYCGLDYSEHMLRQAQKSPISPPLVRGKLPSLPFRDNSFDVVFSLAVMQYSDDYVAWISELLRVTRGFLFIDVFVNSSDVPVYTRFKSCMGDYMDVKIPSVNYFIEMMPDVRASKPNVRNPNGISVMQYFSEMSGFVDFPEELILLKFTYIYVIDRMA